MTRLTVEDGETHRVESYEIQEYEGLDNDGTVDVDGELRLVDDAEDATEVGTDGISLPIDPIDIKEMQVGTAIILSGILGVLLAAVAALRNYVAGVVWSLAIIALVASGLFGIGLELFWSFIVATALLLVVGMVVKWSH